jgi:hypothetical protein
MDAPIFVIGTGRSGTTLLQRMLCAHPRIHITFEASFYEWLRLFPRRAPRRAFLDYYMQTHSFRWLGVDPGPILAELPDPLPAARLGDAFAAILRAAAARHGRARFGDKTPLHSRRLRQIFAHFPDARVIHITRDPRGAAQSLARMPWAPSTLYAAAIYCELDRRWVAPYKSRLLQIRLEDLLAEPHATMTRVLDHVGEPWDDAVLDHARQSPELPLTPPFPWLEGAGRERGAPTARWQDMTPTEVRLIERLAKRVMTTHGYPRAQLDPDPSWLAVTALGFRQVAESVRCVTVLWRLGRLLRDPARFDSPAVQELFRRLNPAAWQRYPGFVWPLPPQLGARAQAPQLTGR